MSGRVAVLLAAVLFGTTGTAQSLGPDATTPLGIGAWRVAIGAASLWLIARSRPVLLRGHRRWLALAGAGVAAYQPSFFTGTERAGVALGTIVALGSGPAFAGLIEAGWMRRRPSAAWARATALAVTGGVVLVVAQRGSARVDAVGVAAALTAGASYAVYAIATKAMIERGVDSTVALAAAFTLAAAVLLPVAATQPLRWIAGGPGILLLAHLGVVTVGVAYTLYGYGLRTLPSSTAVTLTLAEPVTAAVAGVVVLDERVPVVGWVGAGLVVVGLALAGRRPTVA